MSDQPQAITWHGPRTIGVMLALRQSPQEKHDGWLDIYRQGDTLSIYVVGDDVENYRYRIELNPHAQKVLAAILRYAGSDNDECPTCRTPVGPGVPHHHTGGGEPQ